MSLIKLLRREVDSCVEKAWNYVQFWVEALGGIRDMNEIEIGGDTEL